MTIFSGLSPRPRELGNLIAVVGPGVISICICMLFLFVRLNRALQQLQPNKILLLRVPESFKMQFYKRLL